MAEYLQIDDFLPYLHTNFPVQQMEGMPEYPLSFELIEVTEIGEAYQGGRKPFSLIFQGPVAVILPQRIYRIVHPTHGALDIFLVPIGPDKSGMRYQAIFT